MNKLFNKKDSKSKTSTTETTLATCAMLPKTVKVGWNTLTFNFVEPSFLKDNVDCFGEFVSKECPSYFLLSYNLTGKAIWGIKRLTRSW